MIKQYNINGINGLYLTYKPIATVDENNYTDQLLFDGDFFPKTKADSAVWRFANSSYNEPLQIVGSNVKTDNVEYSELFKPNELVPGQIYYNTMKFYFRFYGSDLGTFTLSENGGVLNQGDTFRHLSTMRIKLYVQLGVSLIPLTLTNLEKYVSGNWTPVILSDTTGGHNIAANYDDYGIQLTTGENSEDCIDMGYNVNTAELFDGYLSAPDGYNFRVDASLPTFSETAKKNKDYKIIVRYYNIGIDGAPYPYGYSESMNMMYQSYMYYTSDEVFSV
jgi:hypothetical protein